MQKTKLQAYFPTLKSREELLCLIDKSEDITIMYNA